MKRAVSVFVCLLTMALCCLPGPAPAAAAAGQRLSVLFLHDTHSHLTPFTTVEDGKTQVLGGFARIKTLIDEQLARDPHTLLLDGGDFSMGTLIQVVFEEEAAELRMLGELGFDVTTLGNHELDYNVDGLANMIGSALASGDRLPAMALCNVDWAAMEAAGLTEEQRLLWEAFGRLDVRDYVIIEKGDVRIAVIGVFGVDALSCVPDCPILFEEPIGAVKEAVAEIRAAEQVDMIACVSHSGTWEDVDKSEDELLAKAVPELDLIVSGHTHTRLTEPIRHGDTYIVSAQEYGKFLGSLSMARRPDGRWEMERYELITVDESIPEDAAVKDSVAALSDMVDSRYLQQFGYTRDQVLCDNDIVFATNQDTEREHRELNLGSVMADAYTYAVNTLDDADARPVDVAVVPAGTIRDTYTTGYITTEHVFNSFSLGMGADGIPGYPLISVYLTGAELKTVAEIDASISGLMSTARLYSDGLHWRFNPNRMILNRVTDAYLCGDNGQRTELEDDRLYRVVSDIYSAKMLGSVTDLSFGLLSIVPKYADGSPVENYEDVIITADDRELKAWAAIAMYMESFEDEDGDGIGDMPAKYAAPEGRKVIDTGTGLGELLKRPNKYFFMIAGAALLAIGLLAGIIILTVRLVKRLMRRGTEQNHNIAG